MTPPPKLIGDGVSEVEEVEVVGELEGGGRVLHYRSTAITRIELNTEAMTAAVGVAQAKAKEAEANARSAEANAAAERARADQMVAKAQRADATFAEPSRQLTQRAKYVVPVVLLAGVAMCAFPEQAMTILYLVVGVFGSAEVLRALSDSIKAFASRND